MKPIALLAGITALSLPLLAACADPSHQSDAESLRDTLAALPGVSSATLDYREPITLDSGKLEVQVKMVDTADAEQITEVVTTTYDAFAGVHQREEGDLDVALGDDIIHLRSFEPDAETKAVKEATAYALTVLPSGSVRADINTQDVSEAPHVFTSYSVAVEKPGRVSVLKKLASLERKHADIPDAGWRVQSGGDEGWLLSAVEGFPDAESLTLFNELATGLPEGAAVLKYDEFVTVQIPDGTSPDEASAIVGRHLLLLGGAEQAAYDLTSGPNMFVAITEGDCFFDTGAIGARVEQDHKGGCTKVTHP